MTNILVCKLRSQLSAAQAALTRSEIRKCSSCGREVWIMPVNMSLGLPICCTICGRQFVAGARIAGEPVTIKDAREHPQRNS